MKNNRNPKKTRREFTQVLNNNNESLDVGWGYSRNHFIIIAFHFVVVAIERVGIDLHQHNVITVCITLLGYTIIEPHLSAR